MIQTYITRVLMNKLKAKTRTCTIVNNIFSFRDCNPKEFIRKFKTAITDYLTTYLKKIMKTLYGHFRNYHIWTGMFYDNIKCTKFYFCCGSFNFEFRNVLISVLKLRVFSRHFKIIVFFWRIRYLEHLYAYRMLLI